MLKNQELLIRKRFLRDFVGALLKNSHIPQDDFKIQKPVIENKITLPRPRLAITQQIAPQRTNEDKRSYEPSIMQEIKPFVKPVIKTLSSQMSPVQIKPPKSQTPTDFSRILSILRDPSVFSVECPGPNKPIQVNRAGALQTTPLAPTAEEIKKIMEEISNETRIPLSPGLFKAFLHGFHITAVVSEFVGTRFIIQKRMPFH